MKNPKIYCAVLLVHIFVLLLIWGGINALGVAVILGFPLAIGNSIFFYQLGKSSRTNSKRVVKPYKFEPFRG